MQNDDPTIGVTTLKTVEIDNVHYAEIRSNGTVSIIRHMSPVTGVADFHCVNLSISAIQIIMEAAQQGVQADVCPTCKGKGSRKNGFRPATVCRTCLGTGTRR